MLQKLYQRTDGMLPSFVYKDIQFVYGEEYDIAIVFNFPIQDLKVPAHKAIALLVEPPEIIDYLYAHAKEKRYPQVSFIYSFAKDSNLRTEPAYGIGFTTVPDLKYKEFLDKPKKICMIASDKQMTPFHKRRHEILYALLASDLPIDFYGRNMQVGSDPRIKGEIPPMRKYEVLNEYQFCIDFENSPHGAVTDKYFDAVLCNTIPMSNAQILHHIAPASSFEYLGFDWRNEDIINTIDMVINQMYFEYYVEPLQLARQAIRSGNMSLVEWIYQKAKELEANN
jgi:hypothetical protein